MLFHIVGLYSDLCVTWLIKWTVYKETALDTTLMNTRYKIRYDEPLLIPSREIRLLQQHNDSNKYR